VNLDSAQEWDLEAQRTFWNEWDARYLQDSTIGNDAVRRGEAALSLLRSCSLRQPQILELGCGNGWLAEKLVGFGPVTGVDIADGAIVEARRRVPSGTFYARDALSVNLPSEAFDVVVTLEMFSHVPSQPLFAESMARVLRKDGYLILTTQNRFVYMRRRDVAPAADGQVRRWVTMRELRSKLRPHFKILMATTIQPSGSLGFLRIVNSRRINDLLLKVISKRSLDHLKEILGLGQTLIVLAQKRT